MKCPFCGHGESRVIDTREVSGRIRRRRECQACQQRYTTFETVAKITLLVVKRDGRREDFDRQKLFEGVWRACAKRPIKTEQVEALVADVEADLFALGKAEITSEDIGRLVMEHLRDLDPVAYIRFASVYRSFADLETLRREVDKMIGAESPDK